MGSDDRPAPPFVAQTDYDRRVLRGLELARQRRVRHYVWVDRDIILITQTRPQGRVVTVCTPDGVAINLAPEGDESLIPEGSGEQGE